MDNPLGSLNDSPDLVDADRMGFLMGTMADQRIAEELIADTADSLRLQQDELAARISQALPRDGMAEIQPGLFFARFSDPIGPVYASLPPSFCVIAQGVKDVLVGNDSFRYDPAHYL